MAVDGGEVVVVRLRPGRGRAGGAARGSAARASPGEAGIPGAGRLLPELFPSVGD
jgi:hypothetical protein